MLETLEEEWGQPRKHIRKKGLLRILKQNPYEPFRGSNLPDQYLLNSVLGASSSIQLFSLLENPLVEFPSFARLYYPFAD